MQKSKFIIIIPIVILITIILGITKIKKNKVIVVNEVENKIINSNYDNEYELYYIRDEKTNEVICASSREEELQFYKDNPDYNPNPLSIRTTDLGGFVNYGENVSDDVIE